MRSYLLGLRLRGWHAAPSRPVITAYASSTEIRWAEPGGYSGKKRIGLPRQKRLPDALAEDQVRHLLSGTRNPVRKTYLAVMYACGLRISEATTLEVGAIDRANQVLRIVGPRWLFPNDTGTRRSTIACYRKPSPPRPARQASSAK